MSIVAAAPIGWQDIATSLRRGEDKPVKGRPRRCHGPRKIPQETVHQIREDVKTMPRADVAKKHGVSQNFVYQVTLGGMRDDEREKLR